MDLKSILKALKLNEDNISMVLGVIVILIVGILVVNYFRGRSVGTIPSESSSQTKAEEKTHTVAKDETLWKIAEEKYGSGYNWIDIRDANNIKNANHIEEGQTLTLPDVQPKTLTVANNSSGQQVQSGNKDAISGATYEVVKGDNLWEIAVRAYGDGYKWVNIARENKLVHPGTIHAGNILVLPR